MDGSPAPAHNIFSSPLYLFFVVALTVAAWIICKKLKAKIYLPFFVLIFGAISLPLGIIALGVVSGKAFLGRYGDKNYSDSKETEKIFPVYVVNKPISGEDNIFFKLVDSSEKFTVLRKAFLFFTEQFIQLQVPSAGLSEPLIIKAEYSHINNFQCSKKTISPLPFYIKPIFQGFLTSIVLIVLLLISRKNNFSAGGNILFTFIFGIIMGLVYISIGKENIPSEDLNAVVISSKEKQQLDFGISKSQLNDLLKLFKKYDIADKEKL